MNASKLDETLCVCEQVTPDQVAAAKAAGFRSIICNRPDGEQPGQPTAVELEAAARDAGLEFRFIPVLPSEITGDKVAAFEDALDEMPKPILGYCRTGTRSATLWALVNAPELGADGVIDQTASAGFDITKARPLIEVYADA